jgi:CDP-glucose 4,6-dehydratase
LGGSDPYSASKGMAELAVASYIRSFLNIAHTDAGAQETMGLATARAGNVIGGGDFGEDRLVPDCLRALMEERPAEVRNPSSIRPWQFVLEPLCGYLLLGARLMENKAAYSGAWNFGPKLKGDVTAACLADMIVRAWGSGSWKDGASAESLPEAETLRLCCDKAEAQLGWNPLYSLERGILETIAWYKTFREIGETGSLYDLCAGQIRTYTSEARTKGADWVG